MFAPRAKPVAWPTPQATPRVEWVGFLSNSDDLKAAVPAAESFARILRGPRPPIRFTTPHGLACRDEHVLAVADTAGAAVHIMNLQTRSHVLSTGAEDNRFVAPVSATWGAHSLYVTDAQAGCIFELNADGTVQRTFGNDDLTRPVGIVYVPRRDALYVVDGGANAIVVFDSSGMPVQRFGTRGAAEGQFNFPTHIAYDGDQRLAIADSGNFRVQVLDLDGHTTLTIGQKGDALGDFALPKGLAFDRSGHLYVSDARFEAVQVFDDRGRLLLALGQGGSAAGEFSLPAGIATDPLDRIWIADPGNQRIQLLRYVAPPAEPQVALEGGS